VLRGARPGLPRDLVPVQRFRDESIGRRLVPPLPFGLCRFRPGPSGFLFSPSLPGLTPAATPLLGLPLSSKPKTTLRPHPPALGGCTSPGVLSPTALDRLRRPYVPEGIHPSGTVRPQRFARSRRLASPESLQALFHARCAHGVPPSPRARSRLSPRAGLSSRPGFLSEALPSPMTAVSSTTSSHALRRFRPSDASGARRPEDDQEVSLENDPTGTAESRS
jgi:hypothetical protein